MKFVPSSSLAGRLFLVLAVLSFAVTLACITARRHCQNAEQAEAPREGYGAGSQNCAHGTVYAVQMQRRAFARYGTDDLSKHPQFPFFRLFQRVRQGGVPWKTDRSVGCPILPNGKGSIQKQRGRSISTRLFHLNYKGPCLN